MGEKKYCDNCLFLMEIRESLEKEYNEYLEDGLKYHWEIEATENKMLEIETELHDCHCDEE